MYRFRIALALLWLASEPVLAQDIQPPAVDHHQHLFSPATRALSPAVAEVSADDLIAFLDDAGIQRAAVLSIAYQFANPNRPVVEGEYEKVKAENDWTSAQVARYPDRLRGFCGVNPLRPYAVAEVTRCAADPSLRFGVKLHLGNSDVNLLDAEHRVQLERIPDIPVQIAHLSGAGGYDDPSVDEAVGVFADAIARNDVRMRHVYFDASGLAGLGKWQSKAPQIALRLRQIGMERLLYGSDGTADFLRPRDAWAAFRMLPLLPGEFRAISANVAPYMR
jgi:uncharacterized protein